MRIGLFLLGLLVLQSAVSLYAQADQQESTDIDRYYDVKANEIINAREAAVRAGALDIILEYFLEAGNVAAEAEGQYRAKDYNAAKETAEIALSMYVAQKAGLDAYWVREDAVNARAEELIPQLLEDADNTGLDAIDQYFAKNYAAAKNTAGEAQSMYGVLLSGLGAYKVREEIEARNFLVYDLINIERADNTLWAAAGDYNAGNFSSAGDKCGQALFRYNTALRTGWEGYAAVKGADASAERQRALNSRANVAVRQEFNETQGILNRANAVFQGQRYEEAAMLYEDCISNFEVIARLALEKQRAAEEALRVANQRMAKSDETAKAAEVILEGGI
jgi:hypothetical protein